MPDQPDDPIHYDMKIPPEPKDAPLNKQKEERGSDEVTSESNQMNRTTDRGQGTPSQSGGQSQ
jgi:hypothetical protein